MSEYSKSHSSSTTVDTKQEILDLRQHLAWKVAEAAEDKKAEDIVLLAVAEVSYLADYFVVITGFSTAQVRAISDAIEAKVEQELAQQPLRVEGKSEGSWILQDYGDVIVHILLPAEREFYNLEAFWGHAEKIEFSTLQSHSKTKP